MDKDLNVPELPVLDISQFSIFQLGRELQNTFDKKRSRWIWLKKRDNEKVFLDEERLRALIAQIQDLRDVNSSLLDLNAEVYLTQERFERILQRYREHENFVDAEGRRLSEIAEAKHINEIQKYDDEFIERQRKLEALELENKRTSAEIDILKAQQSNLMAIREKEDIRMELMRKVIEKVDVNELPDYLRTFVINSIFNPSMPITNEMQLMDDLRQFAIRRAEADTRKDEAGAKKEEAQAKIDEAVSEKSVKDIKNLK